MVILTPSLLHLLLLDRVKLTDKLREETHMTTSLIFLQFFTNVLSIFIDGAHVSESLIYVGLDITLVPPTSDSFPPSH
jgi:hypothetical protein